jgi:predicted Zn-dependent protease
MERSADRGGQILAAAAGYDPRGMATFLASLQAREQLLLGAPRRATFFDTHPTSSERASLNAIQASELRWVRDPALGDTTASHLRAIAGIDIGPRPQEGVFVGERFLHPDLDFQIRFPAGWRAINERQAVGAQAPRGDAVVFLSAEGRQRDPKAAAQAFVAENQGRIQVAESRPVQTPGGDGVRLQVEVPQPGGSIVALVTFLPHGRATWRFTGASLSFVRDRYEGLMLSTFRSFRSLTPEQRASIRGTRLELVEARAGETIGEICRRTDNVWSVPETVLANGVTAQHAHRGGELIKIAREYAYTPRPPRP